MNGLDDVLGDAVVAHHPARGLDPARQGRLADEAVTPDGVQQLGLGDHPRPVGHEMAQHVEDLGLDVLRLPTSLQEEPLGVEDDVPERVPHATESGRGSGRRRAVAARAPQPVNRPGRLRARSTSCPRCGHVSAKVGAVGRTTVDAMTTSLTPPPLPPSCRPAGPATPTRRGARRTGVQATPPWRMAAVDVTAVASGMIAFGLVLGITIHTLGRDAGPGSSVQPLSTVGRHSSPPSHCCPKAQHLCWPC